MPTCAACGHDNHESAKFCSECGSSLLAVPTVRREERKVVSVVFIDLVGSTALAESSDPEDVRALLRVYHERARDELERFGGTVEKFIGDAVVAVFGAPVAHEDDAERAVRAALAVRDAVARLNDEKPGRDLHVRIAVNTGVALVSLDSVPGEGEGMVAGDVVNTAARLQSAAPVDGILVGEQTYRSTNRAILYRAAAPVDAKGKSEPITVWQALEARSRFGVDIGGAGKAELVGRSTELEILAGALARSRRERSTQLVTLVGVPGMGKSRLVYELSRLVDADEELVTWRQGRSLPYGEGVSYWALGEIVKAQAGIMESDGAAEAQTKLADAVSLLSDEQERDWVARHLRPLLGLGADEISGDRRGETFAAWRRFLEAVADTGPSVLVFEDLHWADDGLLDFVDNLVDWVDGVPLLVVATARPELLERRPGWGGGKRNASTISLVSLDEEETRRLVRALLGRTLIDAETQQALVERAAGNPLYAEEFVRMLEAGGRIEGGLPDTVQGIVAARIDLLPPGEKELLRTAAVLGKVVWSDALVALAEIDSWQVAETLRSLERKEFLRREHRSAVAGALQYVFVHALVRDAAYGQLPRADRAERHVAVATWIESLPEDRADDRAETLAHHYLTAIDLHRASGAAVSELGARAMGPLQEAGARALALGSLPTAVDYLTHALTLVPSGEEPPAELLFLAGKAYGFVGRLGDELERAVDAFEASGDRERAAEAALEVSRHEWYRGEPAVSSAWLERASALIEGARACRAKAFIVAEQARLAMLDFQYERAVERADSAISLAREISDWEIEGDALVTKGCALIGKGERAGLSMLEDGIALAGGRGRVAGRGYHNLAWASNVFADMQKAAVAGERGMRVSQLEGDEQGLWFQRGNMVGTLYALGRWDESLELADLFLTAPEQFRYMEHLARGVRGAVLLARGDGDTGIAEARLGLEHARRIGEAQSLWPSLVGLAWMARRMRLPEECRRALDEVLEAMEAHDTVGDAQDWHVGLVLELRESGREASARSIVDRLPSLPWKDVAAAVLRGDDVEAADRLGMFGELPLEAEIRFLAARSLAGAGALVEAERQLDLARAFWRSVGATAFLQEADALLVAAS